MSQWNLKLWHVSIFDAHNFLNILGRNALLYLGKVGWWGRLGSALFCFAGTDTAKGFALIWVDWHPKCFYLSSALRWLETLSLFHVYQLDDFLLQGIENPTLFILFYFFCHSTRDLRSPTWDGTHAPCSGSMESLLLDHQGSPWKTQL